VKIRFGTVDVIPSMMELERQASSAAHWSREQYDTALSGSAPARFIWVAEDEVLQGFVVGQAIGSEWELENIVVAAFARRQGLGTQLVQCFMNKASENGAETIFLEVRESNAPARRLYEKMEFTEVGRRKGYYRDPPEDAILYRWFNSKRNLSRNFLSI
jgi:ribosomal-protein-alanine N-acetyltransferase